MLKFNLFKNLKKHNLISNLQELKANYSLQPVDLAFSEFGGGTAPSVIVGHGLLGSRINWRTICKKLAEKLEPKRKIYSVDIRNHGESPHTKEHSYEYLAEDFKQFMHSHNMKTIAFIGHSMSGRAGMYFALKYPNLVERLIVVDISPINFARNIAVEDYRKMLSVMKSVKISSNLNFKDARNQASTELNKIFRNKFLVEFLILNFKRNQSGSYVWGINIDTLHDSMENITIFPEDILSNQFAKEVLFLAGTQSDFIDEKDWPAIQRIFPKSELIWLDAGHVVHIDQPNQTVNLITEFLNK